MGKQHGSLARAGKVRAMTPRAADTNEKKLKKPTGRAKKRAQAARHQQMGGEQPNAH